MLGHTEMEKRKPHYHKNPILIGVVEIDKILISQKIYFGRNYINYFIEYKDNKKLSYYI